MLCLSATALTAGDDGSRLVPGQWVVVYSRRANDGVPVRVACEEAIVALGSGGPLVRAAVKPSVPRSSRQAGAAEVLPCLVPAWVAQWVCSASIGNSGSSASGVGPGVGVVARVTAPSTPFLDIPVADAVEVREVVPVGVHTAAGSIKVHR
jgi:hypothetical protein